MNEIRHWLQTVGPRRPNPAEKASWNAMLERLEDRGVAMYSSATAETPLTRKKVLQHIGRGGLSEKAPLYTRDETAWTKLQTLSDLRLLGALYGASTGPASASLVECWRAMADAGVGGALTLSAPFPGFTPLHRLDVYRTLTQEPEKRVSFAGNNVFGASGQELHQLYAWEYFKLNGPDRGVPDAALAKQLRGLEKAGYQFSIFHDCGDECGESAWGIYDRWVKMPHAPVCMKSDSGMKFPVDRSIVADIEKVRTREAEVQRLYDSIVAPYGKKNGCFWKGRAQEVIMPAYRNFSHVPIEHAVRGMSELWDYVTTREQTPHPSERAAEHLKYADGKRPPWMPLSDAASVLREMLERVPADKAYTIAAVVFEKIPDGAALQRLLPQIYSLCPHMSNGDITRQTIEWLQRKPPQDVAASADVLRTFVRPPLDPRVSGWPDPLAGAMHLFDQIFAGRPDGQSVHEALRLFNRICETLQPLRQEKHADEVFHDMQSMLEEPLWRELGADAAYEKFAEQLTLHGSARRAMERTRPWKPAEQVGRVDREEDFVRLNGVRVRVRSAC